MLIYHYTTAGDRLAEILCSGVLRPSADPSFINEKPLLWFSANKKWEPTSSKGVWLGGAVHTMTFKEQLESFGCSRFGLKIPARGLMDFKAACKYAGIPTKHRQAMERSGIDKGANPRHWHALPHAVSLDLLTLEIMNSSTGQWEPAEWKPAGLTA